VYSVDPDYTLMPGESRMFHTGIYLQIPDGYEIQVRSRSGLAVKYGVVVLNSPGTIDSDYQGECNVILVNHGQEPFCVVKGERIAQFVLAPVAQAVFQGMLDFTEETDRGAGGFGSTGMK
jgi:dUTP pyrophosphatase